MPNPIRRLAKKWRSYHSKHLSNLKEDDGGPSDRPTFRSPRAHIPLPEQSPLEEQPPDFAKQAPRFSAYGTLDSEAPIHRLPTEVILEIASRTTPCSRACLALSSKRLFCVISDGFSDLLDFSRLPAEIPQDPPFIAANNWPLTYQPERWNFLCLLQKDSRRWLACSDCFVLHPAQWFGQTELAVWPLKRSWPQCRPPELEHLSRNKIPRGVVELCPCIKLTQSKKRTMLAYLQRRPQAQEHRGSRGIGTPFPPASGPWWHECRAFHSTIVVETKLHPYLLKNGGLGVITEYTCNRNLGTIMPSLPLACPHCHIWTWTQNSFSCTFHGSNLRCKRCIPLRQCRYCSTRIIGATRCRELEFSYLSTLTTEKDLSDRFWIHQSIFPFPQKTKVLYPKSPTLEPGSTLEPNFQWYNRWYLNPRAVREWLAS